MTSQSSPIFDPFYLPSIQELQTAFPLAESFPTRSTEFPWLNPNFTKTQFKLNNYQVYTQEFIASLGSYLLKRGLPVLEVGAGDGRLTYFLKQQCGDAVSIIATDIKDWEEKGQTNASQDVEKLGYLQAIEKYTTVPTLILSCWMNVDVNWTADFRAQPNLKEYILIGDVFRNGGYGSDALRLLIAYGFNTLNLHRIWCEVYSNNSAINVYRHLGFKDEGILRQHHYDEGQYWDSHMLGLLRSEWMKENTGAQNV